jgi:hypothetical protein
LAYFPKEVSKEEEEDDDGNRHISNESIEVIFGPLHVEHEMLNEPFLTGKLMDF